MKSMVSIWLIPVALVLAGCSQSSQSNPTGNATNSTLSDVNTISSNNTNLPLTNSVVIPTTNMMKGSNLSSIF